MQHWRNFDIELFDHDTVGDAETVSVRVARSPAGEQRDASKINIPAALHIAVEQFSKDELNLQQTMQLGQMLSGILFADEANAIFKNSIAQLQGHQGLRIRIELRSLPLADLPWEIAYQPPADMDGSAPERGFLALNKALSIVRYEPVAQAPGILTALDDEAVEVAMLLSNPQIPGLKQLDLDREIKAVESALRDEHDVTLKVHRQTSMRTLRDTLESRPDIFHFAGHGRFKMRFSEQSGVDVGQGELLLEAENGGVELLPAKELAAGMKGSGVRLAVLNNCESARRDSINAFTGIAPTLVRDGVPAVIAMQYNIRDEHALQFAQRLYHNLAKHRSVDASVTAARLAMFNLDGRYSRDWALPVLYLRSEQSVLFPDKPAVAKPSSSKFGLQGFVNVLLATLLVTVLAYYYFVHLEPRLPPDSIIGGVLLGVSIATIGFIRFVAGDTLRALLVHWLRRRSATVILTVALVATNATLFYLPKPYLLTIVAGGKLLREIPARDDPDPVNPYELFIGQDEPISISDDFRKQGVMLVGSRSLAGQMRDRHEEQKKKSFDEYLNDNPDPNVFKSDILGHWKKPEPVNRPKLGKMKKLTVMVKRKEKQIACKTYELTGNMKVVIMEMENECL